jgi:glucokinase
MAEPPALSEKFAAAEDGAAVISQTALAGEFEICVKALDLFVTIYGAEAGNLDLRAKAVRGVYVGGGIAPKLLAKLKDGTFMRAFTDKGRYSDLLAATPVQVVLNEQAALRGSAYYAAFLSHE